MNDSTNTNNVQAVSNPATQTLFRFVSLRNPQLAKKEGNTKFIFRKEDVKGIFDTILINEWAQSGKSKINFLTEKVKSNGFDLSTLSRTEAKLHEHFPSLYNYSKTLMANDSLTENQVNTINTTAIDVARLWDSLIYQVIVQEDFYVKELITQMLQTIHYAKHYSTFSTEPDARKKKEKQKEITTAKVVVPDSLFIDSTPVEVEATAFTVAYSAVSSNDPINGGDTQNMMRTNTVSEDSVASYLPTESALKRQRVALAVYKRAQLDELKKDLLKTQKIYNSQYAKAYDLASKDYQSLVKPLYDDYEKQLLQVEATFTEEMTAASKKLALSQVVKPEVPEFQFEFRKERDTAFLQKKLSEPSLRSFVNVIGESVSSDSLAGKLTTGDILQENVVEIGDDQFVLPEDENQSFEEMLEAIDGKLSELNDEIYQNTEVEKQEYVSLGGVLIPVNKETTAEKSSDKPFSAITVSTGSSWGVLLTFHDTSISIVNASYQAIASNMTVSDGFISKELNGVFRLFSGNNTLPVSSFQNGFMVKGEFVLSDGQKYNINFTMIRMSSTPSSTNTNGYLTGGGALTISTPNNPDTDTPDDPENPDTPTNPGTSTPTTDSFIPKGFGIKRLGIADYLKVEQTTHAYVEGEVANIENIMAREYRSQSTRRLRRSETTETSSSDTERERSTDTTSSSRFEMQSEVAKILQEATDIGINTNTSFTVGTHFNMSIGASYANHRSKEESMRQAVTQAQEITVRALDRVVTKVHQERVEKIIEEFEENNTHGFDNRKGNQHVVGVYRWVDKLLKNQVWNYGKRMMFEFAIPQPAKLHTLAAVSVKKIIEKPIDPRKSTSFNLLDYTKASDDNIKYWSGVYNVEVDEKLGEYCNVTKSFNVTGDANEFGSKSDTIEIPDNYECKTGRINLGHFFRPNKYEFTHVGICVGDSDFIMKGANSAHIVIGQDLSFKRAYSKQIGVSVESADTAAIAFSVSLECKLTAAYEKQWQQKTFNAIIAAYEDALADYNDKIAQEDAKANNIKDANPMFYRQIEQEVLKHNSIAYLVDDSFSKNNKILGKDLYIGNTVKEFEITKAGLDDYASLAKFMEQAFEWDIMSYNYYPYYWGKRDDWDDMYQSENIDPLFRSFLRSGMARVVVTVRPGFEDAVQFYMATGRLWNGGEVPVIGDPMYLSIVDELKDIKGEEQGKPWITRLPTSLTILQAESIGLTVSSALPFTKEDPALFENPEEVITISNFINNGAMIESGSDKQIAKIGLDEDSLQLTTEDDQVVSELSLDDLKTALE